MILQTPLCKLACRDFGKIQPYCGSHGWRLARGQTIQGEQTLHWNVQPCGVLVELFLRCDANRIGRKSCLVSRQLVQARERCLRRTGAVAHLVLDG